MAAGLIARTLPRRGLERPENYTRVQIALHWVVVCLLISQYATSGAITRTHSIHMIGQRQTPTDLLLHNLHNRVGLLLVTLMVLRLAYRLWAGAPVSAGRWPQHWAVAAAGWVHAAFYAVLITEGVTGAIASYVWWPISIVHVLSFKLLLGLIVVHVGAVCWHEFVLRQPVLRRILAGQRPPE